jgi:phage terminase small subunit
VAEETTTPGGVTPSVEDAVTYGEVCRRSPGAGESSSPDADPPAPADLSERGAAVWRETVEGLEFRADEVALLHEFCRTLDEVDALREAIREGGLTVAGSKGQPRPNPLLASLHASRALLIRLAQQLALPDLDEEQGQSQTFKRAQHAAQTRWKGHVTAKEFRRAEA